MQDLGEQMGVAEAGKDVAGELAELLPLRTGAHRQTEQRQVVVLGGVGIRADLIDEHDLVLGAAISSGGDFFVHERFRQLAPVIEVRAAIGIAKADLTGCATLHRGDHECHGTR